MNISEALSILPQKIQDAGAAYGAATANFLSLDKQKENNITNIAQTKGYFDYSESKLTRLAKSTPEYLEYLRGLSEAKKEEIRTKAIYDATKAEYELTRSLCSQETSKINARIYQ